MPAMLRTSNKAQSIAFSLLGKPAVLQKPTQKQKRVDKILRYQQLDRQR